MLTTERTDSYPNGSTTVSRTVVLYRLDGTAVVIDNQPVAAQESANAEATLDMEDLTGIAEAIPNLVVK